MKVCISLLCISLCGITYGNQTSKIYEANVEQDMIGTGPFLFREFKK